MACYVCDAKLVNEYAIRTGKRLFHQVCFRCVDCNVEMSEETVGSVDDVRCIECQVRKLPMSCNARQSPIESHIYKRFEGRSYHQGCLSCDGCRQPFSREKCYPLEGKYFCLQCHWRERSTICLRDAIKEQQSRRNDQID